MIGLLLFYLKRFYMKTILHFIAVLLLLLPTKSLAQSILDRSHLEQVRTQLDRPYYASAYEELIKRADRALALKPLSVMDKEEAPASGDKHDYMSLARYFWPDPTKPDGLPYISRDGISNPELEKYDRNRLGQMANAVYTLSLAWYFSGDKRYADKANELIRVWFFDKKTRMNPHLRYAQVCKGHNNDLGRCYGVLDTYSFVAMLDGVQLMEHTGAFSGNDSKRLRKWISQLLQWITTDPQAIEEGNQKNNHSVAYDAQVIAMALYTGKRDLAEQCIRAFPERRVFAQIEPDGTQPHELRRTLAFGYSSYNLTHMIDILLMAQNAGIEDISPEAKERILKAVDFLLPYLGREVSEWPYQQISQWDMKQQEMAHNCYRIANYLDTDRSESYMDAYRNVRLERFADTFDLLYVMPDATDDAMAFVSRQMRVALHNVNEARHNRYNRVEGRVAPRTLNVDGSVGLVGPRDWCSGFFAGQLWMLYDYTHDNYWREQAVSNTWPIEEAKLHGGSHDLGFIVNNSFGQAFRLTNEQSYRDVVVQAARTLITRYNPTVGCIRSWDHHQEQWEYPVIVDNMLNLELLFNATRLTGDSTFWKIAVSHANKTMENHFRPDGSSYHVVGYDPVTGQPVKYNTHQGYSDDSYWSRGQGWGLYGFTMCYRFTHNPAYLAMARRIAQFWLALPNMPADGVPYWDMKEPHVIGLQTGNDTAEVPRDASAAAIIASALYELSTYVDGEESILYRKSADHILNSLDTHYRPAIGEKGGFLLLHSVGHYPARSEIDVPITYADYYYLESQLRRQRFQ